MYQRNSLKLFRPTNQRSQAAVARWRRTSYPVWPLRSEDETDNLEPGFAAVLAVGVAEFCFQDASFVLRAPDLHENRQDHQEQHPPRKRQKERHAGEEHYSEKINWIADPGVDAGGHESLGLRRYGKEFADLQTRGKPANKSDNEQYGAGDVFRRPGTLTPEIKNQEDGTGGCENFEVGFA